MQSVESNRFFGLRVPGYVFGSTLQYFPMFVSGDRAGDASVMPPPAVLPDLKKGGFSNPPKQGSSPF